MATAGKKTTEPTERDKLITRLRQMEAQLAMFAIWLPQMQTTCRQVLEAAEGAETPPVEDLTPAVEQMRAQLDGMATDGKP